ncbi:MAG: PAS domain S-box protein [Acidobacteria bacterium]|nr:PAS domain S-box protein [Acidobacteriota bacterium]
MDSDDRGREWLRTTLYSIGDAVITTDEGGRVREMNPVAEALTGWREADAAGRPFAEVFAAFSEDTGLPVDDPVSRILRDGGAIGLATHTVLVARDGRRLPIADSGAPIRSGDGRILGAVVVFRDQTEERRQLRALEDSERRYRELFDANPHAMWIYDADSLEFLAVNAAALARYGYSRDEFIAMTLADIRPAEDVPALLADAELLPNGFEGGRRWRHRRRDGTLLTVEISSHPVPWPGRTARVVLVHDVTAQAALELRLHWQAQILTRLASREPLGVLLDELARFVCTLCPGVMSTIMLVDEPAGVLRPAAGHDVPDAVQAAADPTPVADLTGVCGTAAARREPFVVTDIDHDPAFAAYLPVTQRHGLRSAWSHPFFDSRGRLLGTVAMYAREQRTPTPAETDVAAFAATLAGVMVERSRNLDALHEREAQLRLIFENEPECVKVLDRDGRLLEMNPTGLRLIEAESIDQVRGADVGALVTAEFRDAYAALTRDVAAGGEGRLEFELVGLKGTRRWLETHAAPLRDAGGQITAVLQITRDVTERKALTDQLLQSQKLESVGRLAGGVAHDFNNMLSVIHGQTELALQEAPPGSLLESGLLEVLKAAQRSARLTRQLLAFARREPSAPQALDLNVRIEELIGMLARLIGEGVLVEWRPGPDLWPVHIDPGQLDQILTNLVVNARDAMHGAGTLVVTTSNTTRPAGDGIGAGDYVVLTVTDSGAGMDAATQSRIFEPFFTTKPRGQGTGLGLSTVYGIVRQHGGKVEVESAPGRGATFRVYLPRTIETPAAPLEPVAAPVVSAGRGTILLVEDEPALLALVGRVLRREGYDVIEAASPFDAEAIVCQPDRPIDLMVTDMVMPGMSGADLWHRARAMRPSLRCLIMSGYSPESLDGQAELGAATLHKPFAMRALVERVRQVLATESGAGRA